MCSFGGKCLAGVAHLLECPVVQWMEHSTLCRLPQPKEHPSLGQDWHSAFHSHVGVMSGESLTCAADVPTL